MKFKTFCRIKSILRMRLDDPEKMDEVITIETDRWYSHQKLKYINSSFPYFFALLYDHKQKKQVNASLRKISKQPHLKTKLFLRKKIFVGLHRGRSFVSRFFEN